MRKREIMRIVAELQGDQRLLIDRLNSLAREEVHVRRIKKRLDEMMARADVARIDMLLKKVDWMHERIDLLANRVDKLRGRPKAQPADWMPDYRSTLVRAERQRAKAKRKPKAKARRRAA